MWKRVKKTRPALWLSLPSAKHARAREEQRLPRRIKSVSPTQAARLRLYAVAVNSFRAFHPDNLVCAVCLKERRERVPVDDNHHVRGKLGDLLCDTRFFMSVCRPCHSWIDANRKLAAERGYLDLVNWNKIP